METRKQTRHINKAKKSIEIKVKPNFVKTRTQYIIDKTPIVIDTKFQLEKEVIYKKPAISKYG